MSVLAVLIAMPVMIARLVQCSAIVTCSSNVGAICGHAIAAIQTVRAQGVVIFVIMAFPDRLPVIGLCAPEDAALRTAIATAIYIVIKLLGTTVQNSIGTLTIVMTTAD
jgi:hypothetical protein